MVGERRHIHLPRRCFGSGVWSVAVHQHVIHPGRLQLRAAENRVNSLRERSRRYILAARIEIWRGVGPPVEYPTSLHRLYTGDSRWVFRLGLAASLVAGYWLTDRFALFWWLGIGLLLWNWLAAREPAAPLAGPTTVDKRREKMIVWLAVLLMALICLLHRRPSGDDAFFMNIIVSALDHPDRVLWSVDGMHGDAKLPLMSPIYRFSSYELFIANFIVYEDSWRRPVLLSVSAPVWWLHRDCKLGSDSLFPARRPGLGGRGIAESIGSGGPTIRTANMR